MWTKQFKDLLPEFYTSSTYDPQGYLSQFLEAFDIWLQDYGTIGVTNPAVTGAAEFQNINLSDYVDKFTDLINFATADPSAINDLLRSFLPEIFAPLTDGQARALGMCLPYLMQWMGTSDGMALLLDLLYPAAGTNVTSNQVSLWIPRVGDTYSGGNLWNFDSSNLITDSIVRTDTNNQFYGSDISDKVLIVASGITNAASGELAYAPVPTYSLASTAFVGLQTVTSSSQWAAAAPQPSTYFTLSLPSTAIDVSSFNNMTSFLTDYFMPHYAHLIVDSVTFNEWHIGLSSVSAQPSITMQGTGSITVAWGDGTTSSYTLTSSNQTISHTYSVAGNYTMVIYNASAVTKWSTSSNCAWSFDLASVPRGMTYFSCTGSNTITGNLSSLPSVMTYFLCYGSNTVTGNLSSLPSVMTTFVCYGSNTVTGNLSSLPSVMTYFNCQGFNTITGNLSSLPSVMIYFVCTGLNTITGNLSSLPSVMTYFTCYGSNTINAYTAGHTWASAFNTLRLITNSGGLTSAMVDSLCIDLDAVPWGGSGRTLHLTGAGIGAPTSASAAARTDLTNVKLVTVTTN